MIGIVDYGAGNIQSVMNALSFCGAKFTLARSGEELLSCDKALLPGVGAFGEAMNRLRASGMDAAIKEFVASGRYFLGICLGMQLLFEQSEEFGARSGLGILPGRVVKFDKTKFNIRGAESGSENIKFRSRRGRARRALRAKFRLRRKPKDPARRLEQRALYQALADKCGPRRV